MLNPKFSRDLDGFLIKLVNKIKGVLIINKEINKQLKGIKQNRKQPVQNLSNRWVRSIIDQQNKHII